MAITSNVIQRVLHIKNGDSIATAFVVDVLDRQYLVTAKHVIPGFPEKGTIGVFVNDDWSSMSARLVGHAPDDVDISVLALDSLVTPEEMRMEPSSEGLIYGQDAYFLGFPYGYRVDVKGVNRGYPMPFVKKAIISGFSVMERRHEIFLDGHNNAGFSGGPVVFRREKESAFSVAGVVSGYRFWSEPVYQDGKPTDQTYRSNTGIMVAHDISEAIKLIKANPIGFSIR